MKKIFICVFILVLFLVACTNTASTDSNQFRNWPEPNTPEVLRNTEIISAALPFLEEDQVVLMAMEMYITYMSEIERITILDLEAIFADDPLPADELESTLCIQIADNLHHITFVFVDGEMGSTFAHSMFLGTEGEHVFLRTPASANAPATTGHATTQPPAPPIDEVQLSFPREYIVNLENLGESVLGFQRQFRQGFYTVGGNEFLDLAERDEGFDFMNNIFMPSVGRELSEPMILSFIKHLDLEFDVFYRAVQAQYLRAQRRGSNMSHEAYAIHNPYILFTFNLERINDYHSIDPARHRSARLWLDEWLQTNEPYASYSAFRAANP